MTFNNEQVFSSFYFKHLKSIKYVCMYNINKVISSLATISIYFRQIKTGKNYITYRIIDRQTNINNNTVIRRKILHIIK